LDFSEKILQGVYKYHINLLTKGSAMRKTVIALCLAILTSSLAAQEAKKIVLNQPDTSRGLPVMKALSLRASATGYDTTSLKLQDISDLVWAANGINRPDIGKRTAPSAMNAQDIDIYVIMKSGAYLYDARKQLLELVAEGDHRLLVAGRQADAAKAPLFCLLVSDLSRFRSGEESMKLIWAAEDAGIVSQNIALFCASAGLSTRPRATMDEEKLKVVLGLKPSQRMLLNHPVSYRKE
jgi:nitroreductase